MDLFDVFDVEAGERVEAELDRFIEKRARDRSKENALEEMWRSSERIHLEKRREANRLAWLAYHTHLAANHASLSERHLEKAEALAGEAKAKSGGGAMP